MADDEIDLIKELSEVFGEPSRIEGGYVFAIAPPRLPTEETNAFEHYVKAKRVIRPQACCEKAQPLQCVCAYAYTCPEHGDKHNGTHD